VVDAAAGHPAAVGGDVATLRWIRDRISIGSAGASRVDDQLRYLGFASEAGELKNVRDGAARLLETLAGLRPSV
jgi:hypothetical protein